MSVTITTFTQDDLEGVNDVILTGLAEYGFNIVREDEGSYYMEKALYRAQK